MENKVGTVETTGASQLDLSVGDETRRLLELAAGREGRSIASVLDDAVKLYLRSRSEGYRAYVGVAHRYFEALEGSDEKALAGAELSAALALEQGYTPLEKGGDASAVRARLRQRRTAPPTS